MDRRQALSALAAVIPSAAAPKMKRRMSRTYCTADLTIYVSPSGSDANDGLSPSSPLATITKAVRKIYYEYDLASHNGIVQLADGTYTEWVGIYGPILGNDQISIFGNFSSPGSVQWRAPANQGCVSIEDHAIGIFRGIDFSAPNGGSCIAARQCAIVDFQTCRFGPATQAHLSSVLGSTINAAGPYTIYGGAAKHCEANYNGIVLLNGVQINMQFPVSFSGSFAFSAANSNVGGGGCTFIGDGAGTNSSGKTAAATTNGIVDRGGATFPGNAGTYIEYGGQIF